MKQTPKLIYSLTLMIMSVWTMQAQTHHPAASLDMRTADGGILVPHLTTAQRDALATDTDSKGLLIFNTTTQQMEVFSGADWSQVVTDTTVLSDNDADTSIQVEEGTDDDTIRLDINGNELFKFSGAGSTNFTLAQPSSTSQSRISFTDNTDTHQIRYNWATNKFEVYTNADLRMVIQENGRIGIGESAPDVALHLKSNGNYPLRIEGSSNRHGIGIYNTGAVGSGAQLSSLRFYDGTGATMGLLTVDNSGRFTLNGSGDGDSSMFSGGRLTQNADDHYFQTGGVTRMVLANNGNVGIGDTSPDSPLHVSGSNAAHPLKIEGNSIRHGIQIVNTGATNSNAAQSGMRVYDSTGASMGQVYVSTAGHMDIAANTVNVRTTAGFTTNGANVTSDIRLKDRFAPIENPLAKLQQISGKYYHWKEDSINGKIEGRQIGVIAQEVEAVFPELVLTQNTTFEDEEDMMITHEQEIKYVRYDGITAVLVEAVKVLKGQVEKLQEENTVLKQRLEVLEKN